MITVSLFVLIVDTPIKVESFVTKKQKKSPLLDDPRPPEFRNLPGYSDSVRSCVVNYVSATQDDVAIRYWYQRADLQAAAHDHDYCEISFLEHHVDKANQLTSQEAADLEKNNTCTKPVIPVACCTQMAFNCVKFSPNNSMHDNSFSRATFSSFGKSPHFV